MTKTSPSLFLVFFGISAAAAQATPAVTVSPSYQPFTMPSIQGSLHYSISASERVLFGYNGAGTTGSSTGINGDLGYLSQSMTHPFSMVYSGGFLGGTSGQPSGVFQNVAVSQVLAIRRWNLILSDAVSYLPQTASSGLSGIQGVGDAGLDPVQVGPGGALGILTQQSNRINNAASGSIQRPVTGSTNFQATASQTLLRYVGDSSQAGIDSTQNAFGGGLNHRVDARTSYSANYSLSKVTFSGSPLSFVTQSIDFGLVRRFTRKFVLDASAGPQITSGSATAATSTGLSANVAATYSNRFSGFALTYFSGTNSGSGVTTGARFQSIQASAHRSMGPGLSVSGDVRYTRSSNLSGPAAPSFGSNSMAADMQVNRALLRNTSLFLSYSAQHQSLQGSGYTSNSFNGLSQIISAGLTYSPESMHLGHR